MRRVPSTPLQRRPLLPIGLGLILCLGLPLAAGCPEPPTEAPSSLQPQAAPPADPAAPADPAQAPAGEAQADPVAPTPQDGARSQWMQGAGFKVTPGEGVVVSGTISYAGAKKGTLRVDFLRNTPGQSMPTLLYSVTLDKVGPYSVEVPKDAGTISIVAFLDASDNGPDPDEPGASLDGVEIKDQPITGADLKLFDDPKAAKEASKDKKPEAETPAP